MPFTNTVIPQIPSKGHNIYIMSLIDKNSTNLNIFTTNRPGLSYGSTVNTKGKKRYPAYLWDLYDLASRVTSSTSTFFNYFEMSPNDPWRPLYVKRFSDNTGENLYSKLDSFIPLAVNNVPNFSAHQYSCEMNFSPLINLYLNSNDTRLLSSDYQYIRNYVTDQFAGEIAIYLASKIPMFPMFICSTIDNHFTFGPVFANRISFDVGGDRNLGQVNVNCSFIGGKSLISPNKDLLKIKKPSLQPIVNNIMSDFYDYGKAESAYYYYNSNNQLIYNPYDFYRYRSASLVDIIVAKAYIGNFAELQQFKNDVNNSNIQPYEKIIGIRMDISQEINLEHTYPQIYNTKNELTYMGDKFGPRFASMKSRKVSGSITYFGHKFVENYQNNTTGLTIYFGGPFFYAMKNVDWSAPSIEITPGGGYKYTYNFTARLPAGTSVGFFTNDFNQTVSEFSYTNYLFNINQFFTDLSTLFKLP